MAPCFSSQKIPLLSNLENKSDKNWSYVRTMKLYSTTVLSTIFDSNRVECRKASDCDTFCHDEESWEPHKQIKFGGGPRKFLEIHLSSVTVNKKLCRVVASSASARFLSPPKEPSVPVYTQFLERKWTETMCICIWNENIVCTGDGSAAWTTTYW